MNFFKKYSAAVAVFFIVLAGLLVRLYQLDKLPPGLDWDEASTGYNAFAIAQAGIDEWGVRFPLIFKGFGDYKLPLYIYITATLVKLFGLSVFATRLTAALFGTFAIFVIYRLAFALFKHQGVALVSAFFLAFSPYSVFFSRIGIDMILAHALILIALWMYAEYINSKKSVYFCFSVIFLLISLFAHNLARVVSPLLLIAALIGSLYVSKKPQQLIGGLLLSAVVFGFLFMQLSGGGLNRVKLVGVFGENKGSVIEINQFREDHKNSLLSKVLENKLTFYAYQLGSQYVAHFGTAYLGGFNNSGIVQTSFYPPLFYILLPFYFFGMVLVLQGIFGSGKQKDKWQYMLLLLWLLVAPLSSAITEGAPVGKRYLGALGSFEIIASYGLWTTISSIKNISLKNAVMGVVALLYGAQLVHFLYFYFVSVPYRWGHIYGYRRKVVCDVLKKEYKKVDHIVYSGSFDSEPQIGPLFCLQYNPLTYVQNKKYTVRDNWYFVSSFGKFSFPNRSTWEYTRPIIERYKRVSLFLNKEEYTEIIPLLTAHNTPFSEQIYEPAFPTTGNEYLTGDQYRVYYIAIK